MRKIFVSTVFSGLCLFFLSLNSFADENSAPVPSVSSNDSGSVSRKLDRIIDTQSEILKQLDEIKAELQIVKIRASQK